MKLNFLAGSGLSGVSNSVPIKSVEDLHASLAANLATIPEDDEEDSEYSVHDLCHFVKKHLFPMLREQHAHFLRFLSLLARQLFIVTNSVSKGDDNSGHNLSVEGKAGKAMRIYSLLAEGARGPSRLFCALLSLLSATIQRGSENRMTATSLATIFLPLFFPGAEMEGSAATSYGDSGKLALLTWLLSEYQELESDPVPRDLYADLIQLRARGAQSDPNSDSAEKRKRKLDEDEEVYTSVRFCAHKMQPSVASTPQAKGTEEVEDVTARELAALYAHGKFYILFKLFIISPRTNHLHHLHHFLHLCTEQFKPALISVSLINLRSTADSRTLRPKRRHHRLLALELRCDRS